MTKAVFFEKVQEHLPALLGPDYAGCDFTVKEFHRSSGDYTGLEIRDPNIKVAPVYNLDRAYDEFRNLDLSQAVKEAANEVQGILESVSIQRNAYQMEEKLDRMLSFESAKSYLTLSVCSQAGRDNLSSFIHQMREDILLTVRVIMDQNPEHIASVTVTEQIIKSWDVSEETVFHAAEQNMKELFPYQLRSMTSILGEMVPGELIPEIDPGMPKMYVLTNSANVNGMAAFFAEGVMDEIGETLGTDYYFLPSSVHEGLIVTMPDEPTMDVVHNDKMKFVVMSFDEGTGLSEHAAPGEAIIFALDGEGVIVYEGKDHPIKAGENFHFAKAGLHSIKADKRFKMALLLTLE